MTAPGPVKISKADARRALVRHHFSLCATPIEAFHRLRSVQFDPISPIGCNHDLVLHAHVPSYKIGDWETLAYKDRQIYDGWDKQASLVPFEGWPLRRIFHKVHRGAFEKTVFADHSADAELVLQEIRDRGPLMPKELTFQQRREEWKSHWHSPNVTKRILRALWHTGQIMTAGRKSGQHIYDLTERIVPGHLLAEPPLDEDEARRRLVLGRHQVMGILRPNAAAEIWSYQTLFYTKKQSIEGLLKDGKIVPVEVDGVKAHTTPEFLAELDRPSVEPRVVFIAPLDPFMWDRKMTTHIFDFDYAWEIYVPEAKRRWGYYVLPVLFGDRLVARAEFWSRAGAIEVREWHWEPGDVEPAFWTGLEKATADLMRYASASKVTTRDHIDPKIRSLFQSAHGR